MTSAHSMPPGRRRAAFLLRATLLPVLLIAIAGCGPKLKDPNVLTTPYEQKQLWAVVPFANESGVSIVESDRIADMFMQQLQQVDGIDALPVNRVLFAMQRIGIDSVTSSTEAMQLAGILGVDGIIVGSITAYDPYPPPTLGLAVQLYRNTNDSETGFNVRELTKSPVGAAAPGELGPPGPASQAAGIFDASNHQVLAWLSQYAQGRAEPDGAYGDDIFLVRMELYTQFVSYRLIYDLLNAERVRLTQEPTSESRTEVAQGR